MNVGLHVGDDADAVAENRRLLRQLHDLPADPVWLRQVHGTRVSALRDVMSDNEVEQPADGAWTEAPGEVLAIMTADCLPVVLTDATGSRIAAVHAGWRGLAEGILAEAVDSFSHGAPRYAWLGPAIGPTAFEVGSEVCEAFVARRPEFAAAFSEIDSAGGSMGFSAGDSVGHSAGHAAGKYLANLYELARIELAALGDIECSGGQWCTYSDGDRFYSHRRDGKASGRMATLAWLDKNIL
jgi:YfiH family protein